MHVTAPSTRSRRDKIGCVPAGLDGNFTPVVSAERTSVLNNVIAQLRNLGSTERPLLVGVDGIDGSGKSTFADELASLLRVQDNRVDRSTIDSFHQPRATRAKRGATSPVGFFLDSHDLDGVRSHLLEPVMSGTGDYLVAMFDEPTDQPVHIEPRSVDDIDVLIFDGIFLQREELARFWDYVIFLDGQQRVDLRRLGLVLDELPNKPTDVVAHVLEWGRKFDRYSSGMRYYLDLVNPAAAADLVIDNNDLRHPRIIRCADSSRVPS